ncbi:phosphatase phospho-type [Auriculariales sp. MPI-PUGE-AT-0066]|nr:phosphatase phospho-type [Auriculariales sp. MPI-PUGE-AT-0066]
MVATQLLICDFDWSVVDQDTDRWVAEVLSTPIRRKMETEEELEKADTKQWTEIVGDALKDLHEQGFTRKQIENALETIPFHPAMKRGLTLLKTTVKPKTTFLCLSNANSVYISTVLKANDLGHIYDETITNPAEWDNAGRLRVHRRIPADGPQHGCKVGCKPNMCKGEELMNFLARHGHEFDRMLYLGDGSNDFCPILRLRSQDYALVRTGRSLEKRIRQDGQAMGLTCGVKYWGGAWEVEEIFQQMAEP